MDAEAPTSAVHYEQGCPVCGRTLRIQVVLLGSRVYCQHCGGGFVATDASLQHPVTGRADRLQAPLRSLRVDALLQRAERLLEQARS